MKYPAHHFYTFEELTAAVRGIAASAPSRVQLDSIGKSEHGRDLLRLRIGAEGKPVLIVTANAHAVEQAGCCTAVYMAQRLLDFPDLLDDVQFWIVPRVTPDGVEDVLRYRNRDRVRSRFVPEHEPNVIWPEDIDGDRTIRTMRWRDDEGGTHIVCPDEPRMMLPKRDGDKGPFYRVGTEGVIQQWDGKTIAASNARIDFNRNYPAKAWKPMEGWLGQGDEPLNHPETKAVADMVRSADNLIGAMDLHTGNPATFHPQNAPNTDDDPVRVIGKLGESITRFPYLIGYEEARGKPAVSDTAGTYYDWVYDSTGKPAYVVELGMFYNYIGLSCHDLSMDEYEHERLWNKLMFAHHDRYPDYELFWQWRPFNHPQLGPVELGGWNTVPWSNPPLDQMTDVAHRVTDFAVAFAKQGR
jgi:hypothetical protein